jgi:uncharacterized protein YndB with AHSA1/START domain
MRIPARLRDLALGAAAGVLLTGVLGLAYSPDRSGPDLPADAIETGGFEFTIERTVPGTPREIYDALTGDISAWWDHSFSGTPHRLYIEARPGGGFFEEFNESGDGVRHAVVTAAERGVLLRFEGPLGLAGHPVYVVTTYELAEVGLEGTSTNLKVTVRAAGEVQDGWPETVEGVWHHFIDERFVPYVEAGSSTGG